MSARLKIFVSIIALFVMALFISNVQRYASVFLNGLSIWANNVLPTILPFMILCGIATKSGGIQLLFNKSKLANKLFAAPQGSDWLFFLSLICGYPIGAKLIAQQGNQMDKITATKLATFCTTASPVFILGTVGNGYLHNTTASAILLTSHVLGCILNGLAYRKLFCSEKQLCPTLQSDNVFSSVIDATNSILIVGALIALFSTFCTMVCDILPRWFNTDGILVTSFLLGLLEMTTGCINICQVANTFTSTVLCCSLISFGGMCVILQMMTFLNQLKIKISTIVLTKVTHCAFSTIICFTLAKLFAI